jgi:cytochrome o ubiquinol oxidase subunit 2
MIYTMNGMRTQLNLRADEPGTFLGEASHFSGDGFSDMHFGVQAVSADQFATWVDTARSTGPTLDARSYTALARQSVITSPYTFRSVDTELFQHIVTHQLPPAPGPQTGHPNASVSPRTER